MIVMIVTERAFALDEEARRAVAQALANSGKRQSNLAHMIQVAFSHAAGTARMPNFRLVYMPGGMVSNEGRPSPGRSQLAARAA